MAKPYNELRILRERLLRAGVAPRHVRRYLAELTDHLADLRQEEASAGLSRSEAEAAALQRLGTLDDLAGAMIAQHRLYAWSARVPWAIFALAPLLSLAAAWLVALLILWTGWQIFLPGAPTPFGAPLPGALFRLENIYFQTGRMIYFGAPFLIGWMISALAVRQRLRALWPITGLLLVAIAAATAHVNANRPTAPGGAGYVTMGFSFGSSAHDISGTLVHALVILSLTALPFLIWRLHRAVVEQF
jgi:hypothetical protein